MVAEKIISVCFSKKSFKIGLNLLTYNQYFIFLEYIDDLPLENSPMVFGLHGNAEIGYYTEAVKNMWTHLIDLQPQTGLE